MRWAVPVIVAAVLVVVPPLPAGSASIGDPGAALAAAPGSFVNIRLSGDYQPDPAPDAGDLGPRASRRALWRTR